MAARTALITGALGQDGSLLAESLQSRGYRVVGLIKAGSVRPDREVLADAAFVVTDLTDAAELRRLIEKWQPDELYHLAAFHHSSQDNSVGRASASKDAMLTTNFLSTKALAFALVEMQSSCHLVFASSSQIFTAAEMAHEVSETSPRRPATFYGHTKSWSMDLLAFLRRESALRASSAILFNHESPLRGLQFVSRKITQAAAQAALGGEPKLQLHNIGARVDWSSAHDVVQAMSLIGRSEDACDYVIASGALHSVRDFLDIAFSHVGLDWRQFTAFQEDHPAPSLLGNTGLLRKALGWKPTVHFKEMVTDMVDHDRRVLGFVDSRTGDPPGAGGRGGGR
jgi:GDPmannose 4,6-dehydratase